MSRPKKRSRFSGSEGTRAIIYLRVSTEEQARDGRYGLAMQEEACHRYAQRNAYSIVTIVTDEGLSGTLPPEQRPALNEALQLCAAGVADVLLCYAQDRLSRDVGDFDRLRKSLAQAGVRMETAMEGRDLTQPEAYLMGDIYAAFAAEERRRIAARLLGGRHQRSKKDGLGSGPVPFGYRLSPEGEIVIDEQAARVVRAILDRRLKQNLSLRKTVASLNQGGWRTSTGKKWTVSNLQRILHQISLYMTGIRVWDGVEAQQRWPVIYQEAN
jgi:site-specific DNA recombinase